ncbi:MAG: putative ATP-dependent DNA helicase YoaA [Chlamydiales bacterium]|nr:putative ATP-dependent DNA helicase YoaA [Chlamydiales bacterium]
MNEYFVRLKEAFPKFEVRDGQLRMFEDVQQAFENESTHLIEAGTGIGKSLAYLIPALVWALEKGEPTVITTNTIALQEQLIEKDIPFLLKALKLEAKAVLMKGMQNYVCLRKLNDSKSEIPESLNQWAQTTKEGSKTELPVLPSHDLWEQIGAESESCTQKKCPHFKQCFFFKARKQAADAHIIVANHHLLFADLSIRAKTDNYEEAAVLPAYQRLIIDEAHHIEDVATKYFADRVSRIGLIKVLGRLYSDRGTGKLVNLYRKICEAYPEQAPLSEDLTILLPADKRNLVHLINQSFEELSHFLAAEKREDKLRIRQHHLDHCFWQENIQPAIQQLYDAAKRFITHLLLLEGKLKQMNDANLMSKCEGVLAEIAGICTTLQGLLETAHHFVFDSVEPTHVRWIEGNAPELHLINADLKISTRLSEALFKKIPTIVLCSATLSTHQNFSFIRAQLGIEDAKESLYQSPFDYQNRVKFCVPTDLPDPSHPSFIQEAAKCIWEALQRSYGGAFVLFTSYAMLKNCENILKEKLHKYRYTLFCQGDASRSDLLNQFRSAKKGVLFGTDSFWEGVDVVGEALRCVIIVKLPFKVPIDPLFQARSEAISSEGGSAFFDYSLPHAIVKFKQGFGRLIRNKEDRGCVICLDVRLVKKPYGKQIIKSLPPCHSIFESSEKIFLHISQVYRKK